MLCYINKKM